jgi:hypothetical protein
MTSDIVIIDRKFLVVVVVVVVQIFHVSMNAVKDALHHCCHHHLWLYCRLIVSCIVILSCHRNVVCIVFDHRCMLCDQCEDRWRQLNAQRFGNIGSSNFVLECVVFYIQLEIKSMNVTEMDDCRRNKPN